MNEIIWESKFTAILSLADRLFRAGNKSLNLNDRRLWHLIPHVGADVNEALHGGDDYIVMSNGNLPEIFLQWLRAGYTIAHYKDWTPSQLMASYAAYLVLDAENSLEDIALPGQAHNGYIFGWTRENTIEHCAANLIAAMEAIHYGNDLLNKEIIPDPEKLAELMNFRDKFAAGRKPGTLAETTRYVLSMIERFPLLTAPQLADEIIDHAGNAESPYELDTDVLYEKETEKPVTRNQIIVKIRNTRKRISNLAGTDQATD